MRVFPKIVFHYPWHHLLRGEVNKVSISVAIRNFALDLITLFVPIYIYQYFQSIPLALLFFAATRGLYGILVPLGGHLMTKIGVKHTMLISCPFVWGFYLSLLFLQKSTIFVFLAVILFVLSEIFFWPALHTDLIRFTKKRRLGEAVGKVRAAILLPAIFAPTIGGTIIASLGYHVLFVIVLLFLFVSVIPLFLSKEFHQVYTDSYLKAYKRVFQRGNKYFTLAIISSGMEEDIQGYIWPIFLAVLSIGYISIGGIATVASLISLLFILYLGKVADKVSKNRLLTVGPLLTSGAWLGKYFVFNPLSAFLTNSFYQLAKTTSSIPFLTIFYKKAKEKGAAMDEFIIYREIAIAISRSIMLGLLAGIFLIVPKINLSFIIGAILYLVFMIAARKIEF